MGPKRPSEGDVNVPAATKLPKIEQQSPLLAQQRAAPHSDFSGSVKKKLANSSRTGQACDRCKVRKIRCDPRPEGCSPCAQNRTPCKTTDRITGRATTRGHAEAMEGENAYLRAQVAELQAQLKDLGVEPRPPSLLGLATPSTPWTSASAGSEWGGGGGSGDAVPPRESSSPLPAGPLPLPAGPLPLPLPMPMSVAVSGYAPATGLETNRPLPQFKHASFGDNYLGVSSADSLLSNIKGTSLSVFGHEIDITDFIDNDHYDNSVMSYNHFIRIAMNIDHVDPVPLPEYHELAEYCKIYLRSLNPYVMLVDKRELMSLVWRIGNDAHFKPTPAETVCVHMVLATLKHQIAVRNGQSSIDDANQHYRYSLSLFKDLLLSHTWKDVQALALLSHHLRNFPKPGAAWYMISTTFTLAIELGFHRSHRAWADSGSKMDKLEIEMRKRIFWTMHALGTNLSGKLGRPMPINLDEIDVEFPEPLDDTLPGDNVNVTPFRRCSFHIGIQIAKFTVCLSKLYGTLYSLNRNSASYTDTIRRLEAGLHRWKEEQPYELQDPNRATRDDFVFALFLEYWYHEYILLLHHPAVCRSRDPEVIDSNMDRCLAASQKMLHTCNELRTLRSLDIPWINAVVYIAAIFTTLFIYFQRKDHMSSVDMAKLRGDMDQWVDVMGDWGQLLGSGDKLKSAIHSIVERSLSSINEAIFKRTASQSLAQVALQGPQDAPAAPVYTNGSHQNQYTNGANPAAEPVISPSSQAYTSVPTGATYTYNNGTSTSTPHQQASGYEQQSYPGNQDPAMAPSHAAALQAAAASNTAPPRPEDTYAYNNAQVASSGHQPTYSANGVSPEDWIHFTRTYMHQAAPQGEYLNTATTLMALGGGREGSNQGSGPGSEGPGVSEGSVMQQGPGQSTMQWPGVQYGLPSSGHVAQQ
ncbi:hypothetical protein P280DRAFT_465752 [Massarina eburnea CBS 473.64]|uniref:Zn(2)-C6 fungal-type domain-containing protein n=1 Tax=Massarina eburnea CBS 473.64 TaxID=1395130 RepID=A0A6A6S9J9_9PLEO|nr:hypothetical protein P280DRAFT_465752 [Massarina eburnea CBS 473.64]